MEIHENFMNKCLILAKKGRGKTSPNPMVGCVIVHNNKIIGEGYHEKYGHQHAEVNAINSVKNKNLLKESTLYVNLEPCAHHGKTPPCSDLIINNNIPKVIIGCKDSFIEVSGKGIEKMKRHNINVKVGVLEKECLDLNKRFFTFHDKRRPYIILKWAKSKDNLIAPINQKEKFWMTSNSSKKLVHKWRSYEDAILIGSRTAKVDNPHLTVREIQGENPIRIIINQNLNLPLDLNIYNNEAKTIIYNAIRNDQINLNKFIKIDFNNLIKSVLKSLYKQKIQSLIIEGGAHTINTFIQQGIWDEARVFTANKNLKSGLPTPVIKKKPFSIKKIEQDIIEIYRNV